ncbi:MAG: response regulator [Candidatus Omnitrophota bacterium]|nr:response regulator [Candidatus Omnitrophota bacterium]
MVRKRVLIVDDEVDFIEILKVRLESNNCEVITANNGKEALERIKKDKPNAVLLDIMMPELDGLTVLKRIRQTDATLPVFFITAFSNEERIKIAGGLNASGYIVKTQDLGVKVKEIVDFIDIAEKAKGKSA